AGRRVEKHSNGTSRICWHTIFICAKPWWYSKLLKQQGLLSCQADIRRGTGASRIAFLLRIGTTQRIAAVDCTQSHVWSQLQETRRFPDVFDGSGKLTNLCYRSTAPARAFIGDSVVRIWSSLSGWTTDFRPALLGGTDNLQDSTSTLTWSRPWRSTRRSASAS